MTIMSCEFESHFLHEEKIFAEIAQLVEHNLAKVRVHDNVCYLFLGKTTDITRYNGAADYSNIPFITILGGVGYLLARYLAS